MKNYNFTIMEGVITQDPVSLENKDVKIILECESENKKQFVTVICKDRLATNCYKYLKKGSKILVSGILTNDNNRYYIESRNINILKKGSNDE